MPDLSRYYPTLDSLVHQAMEDLDVDEETARLQVLIWLTRPGYETRDGWDFPSDSEEGRAQIDEALAFQRRHSEASRASRSGT